ncbi:MAG: ATP-dependent RNA helicase HrpA [Pseudomonadota bacterium]
MTVHPLPDIDKSIKSFEAKIPLMLCKDRPHVIRGIARIRSAQKSLPENEISKMLGEVQNRITHSVKIVQDRTAAMPNISVSHSLPIAAHQDEIIHALQGNQVLIVSGETGSGKTTQIPKYCLAAGRGLYGKIGCTQPRRIAAVSVTARIAEEMGEDVGNSVGYKIRFQDHAAKNGFIKIMTDGILLTEAQNDRFLNDYDTIIVDEAHERSLNIDFILGILKTLLRKRNDLKLIITSATIDTEKFSRAFDNAPIISVSGKIFPVEVQYMADGMENPKEEEHYTEMAVKAIDRIQQRNPFGDILVFMPTEQDIRETCEMIQGRDYYGVTVLPLFARLSEKEQRKIFQKTTGRKIIVSTNVAETSLTIPGIRYVVDTGLARISHYSPRSRTTSLPIVPISRSSADQRKGRCGRMENGVCIRLYSEEDYEARELFTLPEIKRANLAEVILRMISLNLGDISTFPLIDRPAESSIKDGYNLLFELDAISMKKGEKDTKYRLTEKGKTMAKMPLDPRLSSMLIQAHQYGCLKEITIIASALSIQDPRERPSDNPLEADQAQACFSDPLSDFISILNIWNAVEKAVAEQKSGGRIKQFCKNHFLSFRRIREWRDICHQVHLILNELHMTDQKIRPPVSASNNKKDEFSPLYTAIHKSILSGFLSNIAVKKEKNVYKATKDKEVMLFPGSSIYSQGRQWIVAAEMVETSRLFARTAGAIDSDWLEEIGKSRCKSSYSNPHWERSRGAVVANEQVSLFGLIIVPQRTVYYGRIHPEEASDIFIREALMGDDLKVPFSFMDHNRTELEEIKKIEARLRRRDILIDETDLFLFYKERLPEICDLKALEFLIKKRGSDSFLRMNREHLYKYLPEQSELDLFPEAIDIGENRYECSYAFRPGKNDDGITIRIPSSQSSSLPVEPLDWMVPGLFREKINIMMKSLPKEYRKQLVPVAATVETILKEMPHEKNGNLANSLSRFIYHRMGIDIPASVWSEKDLPDHLKMRIAITGINGKVISCSRDKSILKSEKNTEPATSDEFRKAKQRWEKTDLTAWDFDDLPESIPLSDQPGSLQVIYPGLSLEGGSICLRLFPDEKKAVISHKSGIKALFMLHLKKDLAFLKKHLQLSGDARRQSTYFGGPDQLKENMFDRIINKFCAKNIRTRQHFLREAESISKTILPNGSILLNHVVTVLSAYHDTRSSLYEIENNNTGRHLHPLVQSLRKGLTDLVPDRFITIYDAEKMNALPRYLSAIRLRAQRACVDFEKERKKAGEVQKYDDYLNEFLANLDPKDSDEKRKEIENFFWLLQEYKVSVFAQELKTPFPVSAKKLDLKINEIKRIR